MMCEDGTYYYKVTAYYADIDCESEYALAEDSTDDFVMVEVVSIDEYPNADIKIYPNPAKDNIKIEAEQITSLSIINMTGQVVLKQDVCSDEVTLDLSTFESGMYLLRVDTESGIITRQINVIK